MKDMTLDNEWDQKWSLIKGGCSKGVSGSYGKKVILEVLSDHAYEDTNNKYERVT